MVIAITWPLTRRSQTRGKAGPLRAMLAWLGETSLPLGVGIRALEPDHTCHDMSADPAALSAWTGSIPCSPTCLGLPSSSCTRSAFDAPVLVATRHDRPNPPIVTTYTSPAWGDILVVQVMTPP